jgi:hypothetical protein
MPVRGWRLRHGLTGRISVLRVLFRKRPVAPNGSPFSISHCLQAGRERIKKSRVKRATRFHVTHSSWSVEQMPAFACLPRHRLLDKVFDAIALPTFTAGVVVKDCLKSCARPR